LISRLSSGGPWEERIGYSRAVVAGGFVFVSGCTAMAEEGYVIGVASAYEQAAEALRRVADFLERAGARVEDVVQTRMYVTDMDRWDEVGRAHREVFGDFPPAAALLGVAALIDPRLLVEVEAVALLGGR
jgi:enamine deaminase RidA (YjgF/YER057c/UK114 family)